VVTGPPRPIYL